MQLNSNKVMMLALSSYAHDSRVRRQAEALVERGIQVEVVSPNIHDGPGWTEDNGVSVKRLNLLFGKNGSKLSYLFYYGWFFISALCYMTHRFLRHKHGSVVIHNMPNFLVFTALVPRLCGCRVILDIHDLMPELYKTIYSEKRGLGLSLMYLEEKLSCRFAKGLMIANDLFGQILQERIGKSAYVVHNAPDPNHLSDADRPAKNTDKITLFHHGNIHHRSGVDRVLPSLRQLADKYPNIELQVHGSGPFYDEVKQQAGQLQVTQHCHFGDSYNADALSQLIFNADIGLVTNRVGSFTTYCMPVKLLEYVECKVPVIASRMKTAGFYFDDTMVYYFDHESEIPALIEHIILHPEQAKAKAEKAWIQARQMSWGYCKSAYVDFVLGLN